MKKFFEEVEIEVVKFAAEDVITTSTCNEHISCENDTEFDEW